MLLKVSASLVGKGFDGLSRSPKSESHFRHLPFAQKNCYSCLYNDIVSLFHGHSHSLL